VKEIGRRRIEIPLGVGLSSCDTSATPQTATRPLAQAARQAVGQERSG